MPRGAQGHPCGVGPWAAGGEVEQGVGILDADDPAVANRLPRERDPAITASAWPNVQLHIGTIAARIVASLHPNPSGHIRRSEVRDEGLIHPTAGDIPGSREDEGNGPY